MKLKVGPRPSSLTLSSCANSSAPAQNIFVWFVVSPGIGFVTSVQLRSLIRLRSVAGRRPGSVGICALLAEGAMLIADQTTRELINKVRVRKYMEQSPFSLARYLCIAGGRRDVERGPNNQRIDKPSPGAKVHGTVSLLFSALLGGDGTVGVSKCASSLSC